MRRFISKPGLSSRVLIVAALIWSPCLAVRSSSKGRRRAGKRDTLIRFFFLLAVRGVAAMGLADSIYPSPRKCFHAHVPVFCRDIPVLKDQLDGRCNTTVQGR
jgi:hypothetical protein